MPKKDSRGVNRWSPAVRNKLRELAELISREKYGAEGPPRELTWAEIEDVGHEVGRLTATEVDQTLQRQHAEQFDHPHPCPTCGRVCSTSVKHRQLQTRDGTADLSEPTCYCPACERAFFPAADPVEAGRSAVQPGGGGTDRGGRGLV